MDSFSSLDFSLNSTLWSSKHSSDLLARTGGGSGGSSDPLFTVSSSGFISALNDLRNSREGEEEGEDEEVMALEEVQDLDACEVVDVVVARRLQTARLQEETAQETAGVGEEAALGEVDGSGAKLALAVRSIQGRETFL